MADTKVIEKTVKNKSVIAHYDTGVPARETAPNRKRFVIGVDSGRGTPLEVVGQGIMQCLDQYGIDIASVVCMASVHIKGNDPVLREFSRIHGLPLKTCDTRSLKSVEQYSYTGRAGWFSPTEVSRLSALYFAGAQQLLYPPFHFDLGCQQHRVVVSVCTALQGW